MPTRANSSAAYVHMYSLIAAESDCNNQKLFNFFVAKQKKEVSVYLGQWRKEMLRGPTLMKTALLCRQLACSSP